MLETAYLSKRLDIRPRNLTEVATRWHRGLERMCWPSRMVRVRYGFWLASDALDSISAYEVRGLVWTFGRPVPVIVEFAEWSKAQSEVGVCPRSLLWPAGTEQYIRRVMAALESVSHTLRSSTHQVDSSSERSIEPADRSKRVWTSLRVPAHS
jgi:hypothetical protein